MKADKVSKSVAIFKHESAEKTLESALGDRYRRYRKNWENAAQCFLVQKFPIHLNVELFYGCNLRCIMCVNSMPIGKRNYKVETEKKISYQTYCGVIDEGVKHGLSSVALNGYNEPLMLLDIAKYICYAKDAGVVDIFLITNATLLTPEISHQIIEAGLTQIKFSMDSIDKDTYEKIRRGANFEKTMENINSFIAIKKRLDRKLPITRISIVKMKENASEVERFVDYWMDKMDYVTVQEMQDPDCNIDSYRAFEKNVKSGHARPAVCAEPYQRLYIRNNGDVCPCCSWYGREITVGNIYQQSIYEIWNGDVMSKFREAVNGSFDLQPFACKKCRSANAGGMSKE